LLGGKKRKWGQGGLLLNFLFEHIKGPKKPRIPREAPPPPPPRASDQLFADATNYTTHNKHRRRTSMPSTEFEPPNPSNLAAADLRLSGRHIILELLLTAHS